MTMPTREIIYDMRWWLAFFVFIRIRNIGGEAIAVLLRGWVMCACLFRSSEYILIFVFRFRGLRTPDNN